MGTTGILKVDDTVFGDFHLFRFDPQIVYAKIRWWRCGDGALAILLSYLSDRWQRTKINTSCSTWSEILSDVPQGSILGPLINSHTCNFADGETLSAFGTNLEDLLYNLEYDTLSAIVSFENNYMKLNQDKCHFVISGNVTEHLWAKVGGELIWEGAEEKRLGVSIDKNLNFNSQK